VQNVDVSMERIRVRVAWRRSMQRVNRDNGN
jgi:hypothetical protein